MKFLSSILIVFFLAVSLMFAQPTTDEQLAAQYFQNKEFDKAVVYYEKLFNKKAIPLYYNYYLSCLLDLKDYGKAEKVVKKQIRLNDYALNYVVDLGKVYQRSGDDDKAKEQFEKAIKSLSSDQQQIFDVANGFIALKEFDYAIRTYEKGRKLLHEFYPFNFEIGDVYGMKGETAMMVGEYLDALELGDSYLQQVQNALQPSFSDDADLQKNEIIRNELLKRIQKNSDKTIYYDLLIWMYTQQKDFESAFVQTKALDKRLKEEGMRVMNLARLAESNEAYDVAVKSYEYIISIGKEGRYYDYARMELLNVMYKKIVSRGDYKKEELAALEKNYITTLYEIGRDATKASMVQNLAHLQAFYLHKADEAIAALNEMLEKPNLSETSMADLKRELGDVLLLSGNIWDASLLYSQVEKAFHHDAIGEQAKLKNAKLAYYTRDFKWAQAQSDVLKGSTERLIANDAIDLALLISDNSTIDTNLVPLTMFARADLLIFQNKDSIALVTLDSIVTQFPGHSLLDDILYRKFQVMMKKQKFEDAANYLRKIMDDYAFDILADDAMFKLADLYENKLNDKEKAKGLYEELLLQHPGSLYTVQARKRFRVLRGDKIN